MTHKDKNVQQPFYIHFILKPDTESNILQRLINAYAQQIQQQYPQFIDNFKQKQQKLTRHKDKLHQINQMEHDDQLRDKILEQIEIKEYQKHYHNLFILKNNHYSIEKQNKTFHHSYTHSKNLNAASQNYYQQTSRNSPAKLDFDKKFRSSLIKKNSFSALKTSTTCNKPIEIYKSNDLRNSQDTNYLPMKTEYQKIGNKESYSYDKKYKYSRKKQNRVYFNTKKQNDISYNKFVGQKQVLKNSIIDDQPNINKSNNFQNDFIQQECAFVRKQDSFTKNCEVQFKLNMKRTQRQHSSLSKRQSNQQQIMKNRQNQMQIEANNPYHYNNFSKQLNSYQTNLLKFKKGINTHQIYKSKHCFNQKQNENNRESDKLGSFFRQKSKRKNY